MDQVKLFYEDELDAVREAIRVLGGFKAVGQLLYPEKAADAAGRALADTVNADRKERLTLAQVMLVMKMARDKGCHGPWRWISEEVGYSADPIEPEDELTRLMRDYLAEKTRSQARDAKLERLMAEFLKGGRLRVA